VPIYALGERVPTIDEAAFVHPDAVVIGDVRIGPETSVWPSAVLRGDYGTITVGSRTSIQDGAVLHATAEVYTTIGSSCVVGHLAHLEGCTVEDDCLIGSNCVVLHRVVVGRGATVAASAVVTGGTEVPPGALAIGIPATIRPRGQPIEKTRGDADRYVRNAQRYRSLLRRID
jgi:carbonic anhydrase/acetyltransferase-like protein (isoleucine patch superfamily)